jgi:glutamate 5-kinase
VSQLAHKRPLVRRVRRAVVKIGSNVLAGPDGLRLPRIRALAAEVAELVGGGRQIVVVSSGAVAAGGARLGGRRGLLEWQQAAAAVGQPSLMAGYERAFPRHQRTVAQVLLTHADLSDRRRYLNARHTLRAPSPTAPSRSSTRTTPSRSRSCSSATTTTCRRSRRRWSRPTCSSS